VNLPNPNLMGIDDWVNGCIYVMIQYNNIDAMINDDWQEWGMQFQQDPYLSSFNPPDPYFFTEWHLWGEQLVVAMEGAPDSPPSAATGPISPPGGTGRYLVAQNGAFLIAQNGNFITTQS
jgi:hypothetical protein